MSPPAGRSTFLSGRRDPPNGPAARTNRENRPEITDSGLRARLLRLVSVLLLCRHVDALEGTHIQHSDFPAPLASPRSRHARRPPACGSRLAGRTVLLAVQPGIRYLLVEVGCSVMSGPALCTIGHELRHAWWTANRWRCCSTRLVFKVERRTPTVVRNGRCGRGGRAHPSRAVSPGRLYPPPGTGLHHKAREQ